MHKRSLNRRQFALRCVVMSALLPCVPSCPSRLFGSPQNGIADARDSRGSVADSGVRLGQLELLRRFEASSGENYTLAAGDEIEVEVSGKPELKGHHLVGPDGRITLPFVGTVLVGGKTREAAALDIAQALEKFYVSVNVDIQVTKYGSNRVIVVGRVASPGPLYFDTAPTLIEVLARSGAYAARPAALTSSLTSPVTQVPAGPAGVSRCAIYRGSEQVLWIDLNELMSGETFAGDLHLRRGDIVYVPDEQDNLISVLGQVQHPGPVRITAATTLVDVIAMAGGFTDDAAEKKISLFRRSTGVSREIAFRDLVEPKSLDEISLQRGDVIYVPKTGIAKVGYVLGKLSPAGTLLMFGALAGGM